MPEPIPCPKCGRLYVWDGARCVNKYCRLGSAEKPLRKPRLPRRPAVTLPASFDDRWRSVSPLDAAEVARLLAGLKRNKYGWSVLLPAECGNFFGAQLSIEFQTRPVPERRAPPAVSEGERELAAAILLRLRDVLREAERRFEEYNAGDPEAAGEKKRGHRTLLSTPRPFR